MDPLRVALVQTRTPATPEAALDHVGPLVEQAIATGARLILTPEATNLMERRPEKKAGLAFGPLFLECAGFM